MAEFDFLRPTDKPALLALSNPDYQAACEAVLVELGYKVHHTTHPEQFVSRFGQIPYQVAIIEECFSCAAIEENLALLRLQFMAMGLRRHSTIFLIGDSFQSLSTMQAFTQSVHAVINPLDLPSLKQIIQQVVSENELFLSVYRDTQAKVAQGKL
jgi:hypothetical protein